MDTLNYQDNWTTNDNFNYYSLYCRYYYNKPFNWLVFKM